MVKDSLQNWVACGGQRPLRNGRTRVFRTETVSFREGRKAVLSAFSVYFMADNDDNVAIAKGDPKGGRDLLGGRPRPLRALLSWFCAFLSE